MIRRITVTKDYDGEYRIPAPGGGEAGAAYTDDFQDMLDTARLQFDNPRLKVKIKNVIDHPED